MAVSEVRPYMFFKNINHSLYAFFVFLESATVLEKKTGTEGTKGAMSDCLPALIAPRIRVVLYCRQQEYESLATPPHILTYSPPPFLQIRRHDDIAKHPEKEKKRAAKAEYEAARLAKASERRSEEDANAAKAAKAEYEAARLAKAAERRSEEDAKAAKAA